MNHQETKQMLVFVLGQFRPKLLHNYLFILLSEKCHRCKSSYTVLFIPHTLSALVFFQCKLGYKTFVISLPPND